METWTARDSARTVAVAASVAAHGAFFVLLVWRLGTAPERAEPRVISVELAPPWRVSRPEPPRVRSALRAAAPKALPARHRSLAVPEEEEAASAPAPAPAPLVRGRDDGVRAALRGLVGCGRAALVGLSAEERERCEARLTAGRDAPAPRLDMDVRGAFAEDPDPYLARHPKNGCKLRAGGDVDPKGKVGAATGVGCALSF